MRNNMYDFKIGDVVRVVDRISCTWRWKLLTVNGLVKCYDSEGRDYDYDTVVPISEYLSSPEYFTLCHTDEEADDEVEWLKKEKRGE